MARIIIQGWQQGSVIAVLGWTGSPSGPAPVPEDISVLDLANDEVFAAVYLSLFCDKRLSFSDPEPITKNDRRGWWGDNTLATNDKIGSYLWRLSRYQMVDESILPEILAFCKDALKWMIDDKVAEDIKFDIQKENKFTVKIGVKIKKPDDKDLTQYYFVWQLTKQGALNAVS